MPRFSDCYTIYADGVDLRGCCYSDYTSMLRHADHRAASTEQCFAVYSCTDYTDGVDLRGGCYTDCTSMLRHAEQGAAFALGCPEAQQPPRCCGGRFRGH